MPPKPTQGKRHAANLTRMAQRLMWAGIAAVLLGVGLGFVKSGECSSVFIKRDDFVDAVNEGFDPGSTPDCSTALDLTIPVWGLIGVGVVLLIGALFAHGAKSEPTGHPDIVG